MFLTELIIFIWKIKINKIFILQTFHVAELLRLFNFHRSWHKYFFRCRNEYHMIHHDMIKINRQPYMNTFSDTSHSQFMCENPCFPRYLSDIFLSQKIWHKLRFCVANRNKLTSKSVEEGEKGKIYSDHKYKNLNLPVISRRRFRDNSLRCSDKRIANFSRH